MNTKSVHRAVKAGVLLAGAFFGMAAWSQTTTFASIYSGAGTSGGACSSSYNIAGVEPSAAGTYPLFVYVVGTNESYNNGAAMAAVNSMASKGYVAATIDYAASQFGSCSVIGDKASCAFNPNNAASAVTQLCSRGKADCSKGIVVAGFSQGSIIAILAKNYDARVQAAYAMGASTVYSTYDMSSCMANGTHTLQNDRLRVVDGERDNFAGGSHAAVQTQTQKVTGYTCAAGSTTCLTSNGSGWAIVKNTQVQDRSADHCYMRYSGDCFGSQNSLDQGWKTGTLDWEMPANLNWLTKFTTK